jgi:uncharacterized membrane protein
MTHALLILLHLLAAAVWVGGMAVMHFAVRPAAVAILPPPQRVPFMTAAIGRFLDLVGIAILVLLASAVALFVVGAGWAASGWSVQAMALVGLAMVAIYGWIRWAVYPRAVEAAQASQWPVAAGALDQVRRLVAINLALGTVVFVIALVGRAA